MIQSVLFDNKTYTVAQAKEWLKNHKMKYGKVDKTENMLRFRQFNPVKSSTYRTKQLPDGIALILEYKGAKAPPTLFGKALPVNEIQKFIDASYEGKKGDTERIGTYVLDKELSTRKAKVYHDSTTGKTVVANRGTTGTLSDWHNNLQYLRGKYDDTDRMKQAEDVQRRTIAKYGKVDTNVGHSQGGIITRKLNEKGLTGEVINLNPASMFEKQKENEYVIRSKADPVSLLHALNPFAKKKNTTTTSGSKNLLKEHGSNILSRLDPSKLIGSSRQQRSPDSYRLTNELSNYDIDAWMEHFKIKNYHGCYIKNELPELNVGYYVINLNGQSHWTCLCKTLDENGYPLYLYYDAFGFPAPTEVEKAIEKDSHRHAKAYQISKATDLQGPSKATDSRSGEPSLPLLKAPKPSYISMENQIQDSYATSCGFYVIAWIKFLHRKKDKIKAYKDFIEKFKEDTDYNDAILKKILDGKQIRST